MGETRGRKKSSRRSRKSTSLSLLSREIVLRGGNASAAKDTKWVPVGIYTVTSVLGALGTDNLERDKGTLCPNNRGRDGPPGTATLFYPVSIDIDSTGNIIILEMNTDYTLRIVSPEGNLSTLLKANRGISDGSFASNAQIDETFMCVVNKANDVFYFVEFSQHRLRCMIADSGNTFSGKPAPGFSAGINTIISTSGNKSVDGDENNANLNRPLSIAIDPRGTRMYIGEENGKCLRMVDITGPKNCNVNTLFEAPEPISSITVDNNGNVFFIFKDGYLINRHAIWKFVPPPAGVRITGSRRADGSIEPLYSFTDPIDGPKIFAGSDTPGYKDGAGANARFNSPLGMCVDKKNNLYVADCKNNVIRYITPDGNVFTYAGVQSLNPNLDGVANGGDGTHMTARFSNPRSVAMGKFNNLFVLDMGRDREGRCIPYARIRRISRIPPLTLGKVQYDRVTITWPPPSEWMTDALPGEDINTYSYTITPVNRDFQVSVNPISSPLTITNLSESTQYSIQIVVSNPFYSVRTLPLVFITKNLPVPPLTIANVETNSVTITWPPATQWMPDGVAVEDTTYSYSITPADRDFEVFSDTISSPLTITNLSDSTRYSIQIVVSNPLRTLSTPPFTFVTKIEASKFAIRTPVSTTVAGKDTTVPSITTTVLEWDGAIGADTLSYSISPPDAFSRTIVTLPRNHKTPYTITDLDASKTYTITLTASMTNAPGLNGGAPVTYSVTSPSSTFTTPPLRSMKIGTICGIPNNGILKQGGEVTNATKIPRPASSTTVQNPRGVVLDKHGNLFVTSNSCVLKIAPPITNVYVYMRGQVPAIFLPTPHTTSNSTVTIYAGLSYSPQGGTPSDTTGDKIRFYNMSGMAYDPLEDALYVSDSQLHLIVKLTSDSTGLVTSKVLGKKDDGYPVKFADGPIGEAKFNTPKGIAIGPDGSLFIADCYNHAVRRVYQGNVTTIAQAKMDGTNNLDKFLMYPYGIAALYDGSVYVTSTWRHCIKKLTPNGDGTYTTSLYAGQDSDNASDTDGTLLNARFHKPQGLFVDVNNNIYVYDAGNQKIKLISGGRVMTVFGSRGYKDGNKNDARLEGPPLSQEIKQDDYGGLTSDNNGNIYFTDWGNGLLRCAFPEPPPIIDKATYDAYWGDVNESSAVAQRTSSAISARASSAKAQKASSSRESSAKVSSAKAQAASSPVAQVASSAVIQGASSAVASSAKAQAASSPVAQVASSAVTEAASSAVASSAVAQRSSSAVAQVASSAVTEAASSAQESSAVVEKASSAVAQVASSAVAQAASSAQESSAVVEKASSAVAQVASSAVAQLASSAQESSAVVEKASSAVIQGASSAVAQLASSAVAQKTSSAQASSARQVEALAQYVSEKDAIVQTMKIIQSDLNEGLSMLYSKSSTQEEVNNAQQFIRDNIPSLEEQWTALSEVSASIFSIAPMYQDRLVQTAVYRDSYLESKNLFKIYDLMRKSYNTIDSNGYIISNVGPTKRLS